MKLTFITRKSTKKIKPQEVPLFLRLRDESVDIWQKTAIVVAPEKWDQKTESLKSRMVLNKQERDEFAEELFNLKKFVSQRPSSSETLLSTGIHSTQARICSKNGRVKRGWTTSATYVSSRER